jgi:receptor expression-enhancing protein 1/2/3/4
LMARFNIPSARPAFPSNPIPGATSTANDFYALLASAVTAATGSSSTQVRDLSNSGTLIPPTIDGAERLKFIAAQRERLSILLSALDKEANTLQSEGVKPSAPRLSSMFFDGSSASEEEVTERPKSAMSGLSTRRSEADFEKIDAESGTEEVENTRRQAKRTQSSSGGSWMPWSWGAKAEEAPVDTVMSGTSKDEDKGKSSGVDA